MRLISGNQQVSPDITALPCPGRTPGHTGFLVDSGEESLLISRDFVHIPEVQVRRPEVTIVVNVDPAATEAYRRRIFGIVATNRLLVARIHLHYPGCGHVARVGEFLPVLAGDLGAGDVRSLPRAPERK